MTKRIDAKKGSKDVLISIVIPTLNASSTLGITLKSIFNNTIKPQDYEVLVVDGGSKDDTILIARQFDVKVLSCPIKGAAAARNIGIANARGEIVYFVDADCILPPDTLQKIVFFFDKYEKADGVGGPLLPKITDKNNIIQRLSGEIFLEIMRFPETITMVKPRVLRGSLLTGNCAYKRELLTKVGGFNIRFKTYGEDIELCWRLALKGYKLFFWPELIVWHIFPRTLHELAVQYIRWGIASSKLKKRFFGRKRVFLDHNTYKVFIRSFAKIFLRHDKMPHALKCFSVFMHIIGKIAGSFQEGIVNL